MWRQQPDLTVVHVDLDLADQYEALRLGEVDVANVAPLTSIVDRKLHLRADEVTDGGRPDDVVANAPAQDDHFYVVPKVVE